MEKKEKEKIKRPVQKKSISAAHHTESEGENKGLSMMPPLLQFKSFKGEEEEDKKPVQKKSNSSKEEEEGKKSPIQKKSNPNGMPENVQTKMENAFGHDFSNVNIHTNSGSAKDMGALAYAQGNDVHFASGQYNPESSKGQELIGHELTHVVQQREGRVKPTTQAKGVAVNDDKGLEKEADDMGRKVVQGKVVQQKSLKSTSSSFRVLQKQEDGSGEHGGEEASIGDRLSKQFWYRIADSAEGMGLVNAARHMRHYLNNTGIDLSVSADNMLRDLPGLETRFNHEITIAREEVNRRLEQGQTEAFHLEGERKGHYARRGVSNDWFFAIGGFTYWYTADVRIDQTGGGCRVIMDIQLHVFDRYNWDEGKSVNIAGVTINDESLGALHRAGIAQEYEVNGVSGIRNISWDYSGEVSPSEINSEASGSRSGTRSEIGRDRSSDRRQDRELRDTPNRRAR